VAIHFGVAEIVGYKVEDTLSVTFKHFNQYYRSVLSLGDRSIELTGEISLGNTRARLS